MSHPSSKTKALRVTAAALAMLPALASAGIEPATESKPASEADAFDQLWAMATLYKNDSNHIIEEFKLRGRYHGQFHAVDADEGHDDIEWEDRRSRFGFDAKLFDKKLEARFDFQSNNEFRDLYDGLVDAYLRYKPNKNLSFTLGKTKPLIAQYDWVESTNAQPTLERSQIFNQLGINRATAFTVEATVDKFSYRAGVYLNGTPTTTGGTGSFGDGEFLDHDGGKSYSVGIGYDFKDDLHLDKADVKLDWLHSEREEGDLVLNKYDDIVTATIWLKEERAAIVWEGFYATGGDGTNSDVFGFYIEPTYDLIPKKLQLVGRASYANSDGPAGVVGQSRYEKLAADNKNLGDEYYALYGGLQYFIYGDKLKLMAGVEYARLDNPDGDTFDGFTYLTGLRFSF